MTLSGKPRTFTTQSWAEFSALRDRMGKEGWPAQPPASVTGAAKERLRYGFNVPGSTPGNAAFAMGREADGWSVWIDADFDATFAETERHRIPDAGATLDLGTSEQPVPLRLRPIPGDPPRLEFQSSHARAGTLELNGDSLPFELRGSAGAFGRSGSVVVFDLDGDGTLDDEELSDELYPLDTTSPGLAWAGVVWSFEVAADGSRLELIRDHQTQARPSVEIGRVAPALSWTNGDGDIETLSALGQPVVLEFWSPGCSFCRKFAPEVAAAVPTLEAAGARLISITIDGDDELSETAAAEFAKTWTVIGGDAGQAAAALFRVRTTPMYVVVDREGTMVARGHWLELGPQITAGDLGVRKSDG